MKGHTPPTRLGSVRADPLLRDDGRHDGPRWWRGLLAILTLGGASILGYVLLTAPERAAVLPRLVREHLGESGVSNPVTAVLLDFRSYDTLLEITVLMVAMTAVWSMDRGARSLARETAEAGRDPVMRALARFVVPLAGLFAVYLTWSGSHAPGGAFQAGALLAGIGVLLTAAGFLRPPSAASRLVRGTVAGGVFVFVLLGFAVMLQTGRFLQYPDGWGYPLMLAIEAVLTVSIAFVLVELFVDVPAVPDRDPALESLDPTGDPLGRVLSPGGGLVEGEGEE